MGPAATTFACVKTVGRVTPWTGHARVLPVLRGSGAKTDVLRVCLDSIATRTVSSSVQAADVIVSSAFANVQPVSSASLATCPALKTHSVATVLKLATVTGSSQPDVTLL